MALVVEDFIAGTTGTYWDTDAYATATSPMDGTSNMFPWHYSPTTAYTTHVSDNSSQTNPIEINLSATSGSPSGGMICGYMISSDNDPWYGSYSTLPHHGVPGCSGTLGFSRTSGPFGVGVVDVVYGSGGEGVGWFETGYTHDQYNGGFYEFYIPASSSDYAYMWYNGRLCYKTTGRPVSTYTLKVKAYGMTAGVGASAQIHFAYLISGATGPEDAMRRWSTQATPNVFSFGSNITTATPDSGTTLDVGTWDNVLVTPQDEYNNPADDTTLAEYTGGVSEGLIVLDDSGGDSTTGGLATFSALTDGDIYGAKAFMVASRGGGGGTAQYLSIGNSLTNMSTSADLNMDTAQLPYSHIISASDSACPAPGDDLVIGVSKDGGGQDYDIAILVGSILARRQYPADIASINGVDSSRIEYINNINRQFIDQVVPASSYTDLLNSNQEPITMSGWGWWQLNEEVSGVGFPDASSANDDMDTIVGNPSIVAGFDGNKCMSVGTSDYISCSTSADYGYDGSDEEFSLSIWANPSDNNSTAKALIGLTDSSSGGWILFHQNSTWTFRIYSSSTAYDVSITNDHTVGDWHNIQVYYSDVTDEMGIRVNGGTWDSTSTAMGTGITYVNTTTYPLCIGGQTGATYSSFNGKLYQAAMWKAIWNDLVFEKLYWGASYSYYTVIA